MTASTGDRTFSPLALKAELIATIQRLFPEQRDGLVVVVNFQQNPCSPEAVNVSTVWAPDNGTNAGCIWVAPTNPPAAPAPDHGASPVHRHQIGICESALQRLNDVVTRLEAAGVFHTDDSAGWIDGNDWWRWMEPEPDAYPGLSRLVITVIARSTPAATPPRRY